LNSGVDCGSAGAGAAGGGSAGAPAVLSVLSEEAASSAANGRSYVANFDSPHVTVAYWRG
jgi:hypothetical protein